MGKANFSISGKSLAISIVTGAGGIGGGGKLLVHSAYSGLVCSFCPQESTVLLTMINVVVCDDHKIEVSPYAFH